MQTQIISTNAELLKGLAELFLPPQSWIAQPGKNWQFFQHLKACAAHSSAAQKALLAFGSISGEPFSMRQKRYESLFGFVDGPPQFWLYESAARNGKLISEITFELEKIYRAAGVESALGAELPDHISLELAFIASLYSQMTGDERLADELQSIVTKFLKRHGDWVIQLGRGLADSGDEVYAPIGAFLADWLTELAMRPPLGGGKKSSGLEKRGLPVMTAREDCNLCGFCVQTCPTHALAVIEDEKETRLMLNTALCIGCGKCERICEQNAMKIEPDLTSYEGTTMQSGIKGSRSGAAIRMLNQSKREICPACNQPTISEAELAYVATRLGDPIWLKYCLDCRPKLINSGD